MEDELEFDLDSQETLNNKRSEKRFNDLTEKLKAQAEANEKAEKEKADALAKVEAAEKERDFYASFSKQTAQYQGASDHIDAIKEKVMGGYSVEDATVSVLAKEGKLNMSAPAPERSFPAGGSATNAISQDGPKSLWEMSRDDKRAALQQLENEEGGISNILRRSTQ